jgi:hypothetical protein
VAAERFNPHPMQAATATRQIARKTHFRIRCGSFCPVVIVGIEPRNVPFSKHLRILGKF